MVGSRLFILVAVFKYFDAFMTVRICNRAWRACGVRYQIKMGRQNQMMYNVHLNYGVKDEKGLVFCNYDGNRNGNCPKTKFGKLEDIVGPCLLNNGHISNLLRLDGFFIN